MKSVILYQRKDEDIRITIEAYFENDLLVIDGYDRGKRVEEYWGNREYEYMVKIPSPGIEFLYTYFHIARGNQQALLEALSATYNTASCYSNIRKLMEENRILCEGFTWS